MTDPFDFSGSVVGSGEWDLCLFPCPGATVQHLRRRAQRRFNFRLRLLMPYVNPDLFNSQLQPLVYSQVEVW